MTLQIILAVNDKPIASARITNQGHPATGDHPKDDDLRLYHGIVDSGGQRKLFGKVVTIYHRRSDGAWELVLNFLNELDKMGVLKK